MSSVKKRKVNDAGGEQTAAAPTAAAGPMAAAHGRPLQRAPTINEVIAAEAGREIIRGTTELDEWDIKKYHEDARLFIILGKRNTGKTVMALNWCFHHRSIYPYALVITKTKFNGFWQKWFPDYLIIDSFRPSDIEALFRAQQARVNERGVNSRVLIIFDDMASDVVLRYSDLLTTIAYNGR